MNKAKVIQFPIDRVNQNRGGVYAIFSKEEADSFMKYHELGVEWRNKHRKDTFYDGYPFNPPGEPLIEDLIWFTDEQKNFGVWILNKSNGDVVVNNEIEFGWSPFVRKSVAPPNEPVHIQSSEFRKHLVWFVDENGYGQYGVIQKDGEIWLPHPKENNHL
ncbi:hypothetical protein EKG37_21190 [Robertmurraya yapensis]|uniref:Uncharacterized protein n=1 Tax=Bacillus yapensis TaxID=2492960 RepID=A0A431VTP4_9BACI|nr:hypothetical protein [Bacillus yapensis]RTR26586.1 hypothetical protein EKG37_21190 [Bacillus yapensis]TKS93761.1 hypothetical protein FAR12_21195 [Bacillus yapensis]